MGAGNREELAKIFQASWLSWLILFISLALAGWMIVQIRRRFRGREDPAEDHHQMLLQMGELRRQGGLSDEEYRSIQGRLKQTVDDPTRGSNPKG